MEPYQQRLLKRGIVGVVLVALAFSARKGGLFGDSPTAESTVAVFNDSTATLELNLMPLTESSRAETWGIAPGQTIDVPYKTGDFLGLTDTSYSWAERFELIGVEHVVIRPSAGQAPFQFERR